MLEYLTDWCWDNKLKFGFVLGGLAVFGYGAGSFYETEQKALHWATEAAMKADDNLLDV